MSEMSKHLWSLLLFITIVFAGLKLIQYSNGQLNADMVMGVIVVYYGCFGKRLPLEIFRSND